MELRGLEDPFCKNDPRLIEREIIDFIIEMKKKKMSYSAIQNYTVAALVFYKINDVLLNVRKIGKYMTVNYIIIDTYHTFLTILPSNEKLP